MEVEDEVHFILKCPFYDNLRNPILQLIVIKPYLSCLPIQYKVGWLGKKIVYKKKIRMYKTHYKIFMID